MVGKTGLTDKLTDGLRDRQTDLQTDGEETYSPPLVSPVGNNTPNFKTVGGTHLLQSPACIDQIIPEPSFKP